MVLVVESCSARPIHSCLTEFGSEKILKGSKTFMPGGESGKKPLGNPRSDSKTRIILKD